MRKRVARIGMLLLGAGVLSLALNLVLPAQPTVRALVALGLGWIIQDIWHVLDWAWKGSPNA